MSRNILYFAGPLPPPMHGMAAVNRDLVRRFNTALEVETFDTSPGTLDRGLKYHFTKATRAMAGITRLATRRDTNGRVFYSSVDDGLGGIWTLAFVALARAKGMKVFLHHHSFSYLNEHSWLIAAVTRMAGRNSRHVVLTNEMGNELVRQYSSAREIVIAPNAVSAPDNPPNLPAVLRPLTIGMLANLTVAKGVDTFLQVLHAAQKRGLSIRGVLAGPAGDESAKALLQKAQVELVQSLEWRGRVDGVSKEKFFQDIDLFVFPTRYKTEAYPLVLLEALARGIPIVSTRRGCIGSLSALTSAFILSPDEDFQEAFLPYLERLASDGKALANLKRTALNEGTALNWNNACALKRLEKLVLVEATRQVAEPIDRESAGTGCASDPSGSLPSAQATTAHEGDGP